MPRYTLTLVVLQCAPMQACTQGFEKGEGDTFWEEILQGKYFWCLIELANSLDMVVPRSPHYHIYNAYWKAYGATNLQKTMLLTLNKDLDYYKTVSF